MSDVAPYSDPETKFLREERPLGPITRPAIRPDRPDSGFSLPSSPAPPVSLASSEFGDFLEPSDTLWLLMVDRLFGKWQVWAKKEKILKDRHEKIMREAPLRLLEARSEVRRKSLSSLSDALPTTVAPNSDPPRPKRTSSGRKSSISPPDAPSTARVSFPDAPPRDVPPGTKSLSSRAPEASPTTVAPNSEPPRPKRTSSGRKSSISPPDAPSTARVPIPDPPPRDVPPGMKPLPLRAPEAPPAPLAPSPDPPLPEYAPFGRESSISPPDAHFTARAPIPEPPPRDVPPGTRSPPALNIDALPPRDVPPSPPAVPSAFTEDVELDAAIRASLLDAPPPRRHDDLTSTTLPHRPDASSPRRHDDPTLQTLPPRRHGYPPSPPSSIAASDVPPESVDSSDLYPYRKTFSCDIKDLPAELASHSFHHTIECLLKSEPDSTNRYWCRRSTYTEDNFEQWVEWSPPSKTHRDERACMKDLDTDTLLKAPGLLATDKKVLEDAWGTYRPYLLDQIQQALSVGCDWKRILQRLNLAFSDPKRGYPRLEQYVGQALRDRVLIKFPLLHADVLIYQLDRTYSEKGTHNPNYTRWSRTFLRESGEDVSSLANRVESAYLDMLSDGPGTENSRKFTKETIYQRHDAESCRISSDLYERFRECLRNDVDNPARGLYLELMCEQEEDRLLADYEKNRARLRRMDGVMPEQLEQLEIVSKPPTLEDLAIHVSAQSVERHGNTHNHYSADVSDPHLVSFIGQCEDSQGTPGFRLSRPGGTYRVPPRKSGDFTWRNQPDFWVLVDARTEPPPKSDFAELVDADDGSSEDENDEESYKNHRGGRPRSHMNSRDRRRVARQHLQLERKPQKPSKPPSYNAEPPPKSYNTEPPPKGYNAEPNHD